MYYGICATGCAWTHLASLLRNRLRITLAAGFRGQVGENQPTNAKKSVVRLGLLILTFLLAYRGGLLYALPAFSGAPVTPGFGASPNCDTLFDCYLGGLLISLTSLSELSITYSVQFVNYFFLFFSFGSLLLNILSSLKKQL